MSRAERKLAELKAKEELARLKAEKRVKQQRDYEEAKKTWSAMPPGTKRTIKIVGIVLIVLILIAAFSPSNNTDTDNANNNQQTEQNQTNADTQNEKAKEKTPKEKLTEDILNLISTKSAFDTGSYVKGDIPKGEYAFVPLNGNGKYYSEEDAAGNIIDNENFSSFGYVYVHGAGNISTQGVLIPVSALEGLGVTGAKDAYEKLNDVTGYTGAGMYKAEADIVAGKYTLESQGSGYVAVLTGPVGNNEIVDNENFSGKYAVNVQNGQYLSFSRAEIAQ